MKQTSQVSKLAGISKRTLQYYDDEGVLTAKRSKNNYRLYSQEDLEAIWKIMIYKEIGFDLNEIKQLLSMPDNLRNEQLKMLRQRYEEKIREANEKMNFISFILTDGIPKVPTSDSGHTYKDSIAHLRKCGSDANT